MRSLFVSPHYDDAIFSCGKLISTMEECTIATIFGGVPKNKEICTAYDQKSGFDSAEEAVLARRDEDFLALSILGVKQIWMDISENQYHEEIDRESIKEVLVDLIKDYDEIYIPLGISHPDHELLGQILREIITKKKTHYVYMELPYYIDNPELAVDKLKNISKYSYIYRGGDLPKKMLAISFYKSQVKITNIYHLMADERYYKLP